MGSDGQQIEHGLDVRISFWQKITLKVNSARDRIEDALLGAEIPESIRKHLTFYRLHVIYFLLISVCGTSILYIAHRSDAGERHFSIVDSIFNAVSVATVTGLTSVRIADLSLFDRILFLILMTLGSPAFTSLIPLCVRRFYFFRHHRIYKKDRIKEINLMNAPKLGTPRPSYPSANPGQHDESDRMVGRNRDQDATSAFATEPPFSNRPLFISSPEHSMDTAGGRTHQLSRDLTVDIVRAFDSPQSRSDQLNGNENQVLHRRETGSEEGQPTSPFKHGPRTYPSSPFNIMRTTEHQALVVLSWLVPVYIIVSQLASIGISLVLFSISRRALTILKELNLNTFFFSTFTVIAAFTNSGVPANDQDLLPFQSQYSLLLLYTVVSLLGNLLYPPCLRFIIWILQTLGRNSKKPVYAYLLNHPRRCFTHLFPHKQSVWLCLTVIGFTSLQLIIFCALEWHSDVLEGLNPVGKIVDGIYQSVSVRNAGGDVIDVDELDSAMLVLYLFMMFIAVYPLALLRQNSSEYEYTDISIYNKGWEEELTDNSLTFQSRKLLARDSVYLCVILFTICLVESRNIANDPLNYSIFNIIFELVSAYGGVGMSVGYSCSLRLPREDGQPIGPCTDVPYSFSGKWSSAGKLILTVVMFMGRHRGLPDDIDSAIKLPHFKDTALASGKKPAGPGGTYVPHSPAEPGRHRRKSLDQTSQDAQHQSQLGFDNQSESGTVDRGVLSVESHAHSRLHSELYS